MRYLERNTAAGGGIVHRMQLWVDYIEAAEGVGLDLTNVIHLLPRDLSGKHDEITGAWAALQGKAEVEKCHRRLQKLVQRYTYTDGTYLIRPPVNGHEIVREGQKLCHCVGGYVDRHLNGAHHDPVFAAAGPSGPTAMHHRGKRQYHPTDPRLG